MVHKLSLYGHVHGRPYQKITSFHSWPLGVEFMEACRIAANFDKAFTLNQAVINGQP